MLSHKPDFHLSLTRFCTLRELCTQIRWRKIRYSVASLLTNPVSSSTQPQGIISNTPQVMRGVSVCACACVYASQKYGRSPRSSFLCVAPELSRCSLVFAPRGGRLPPPVLFLKTSGCAIRICFGYDNANEFSAAWAENIHVRAAFAFA